MAQDPDKPLDNGRVRLPRVDPGMNRIAPSAGPGGKGSKDDKKPVALRAGERREDKKRDDQAILARALKNFDRAAKAEDDNRKAGLDDDKFYRGEQCPSDINAERNADRRPVITVNKLPTYVHQ